MKFRHFDIHALHDALGWVLAGALLVIGLGLLWHLPLMGLSGPHLLSVGPWASLGQTPDCPGRSNRGLALTPDIFVFRLRRCLRLLKHQGSLSRYPIELGAIELCDTFREQNLLNVSLCWKLHKSVSG